MAGSEGHRALAGGLTRLDLVIGGAWRSVLTLRSDATGQPVGVSLTHAIAERAVVLWRTHVDLMPDEAKTITAVILNDVHASAVEAQADGPTRWTCVLDEFGAVVASDERSSCEIPVHPAAQLPIGAPRHESATASARPPVELAGNSIRLEAQGGATAPPQRQAPAQSFDDA